MAVFGSEEKHCDVFVGIQEFVGLNLAERLAILLWVSVVVLSQMLEHAYGRPQLLPVSNIGTSYDWP